MESALLVFIDAEDDERKRQYDSQQRVEVLESFTLRKELNGFDFYSRHNSESSILGVGLGTIALSCPHS